MTLSVLVCGATGFVGRHLVHRLRESGHAVTGATRRPEQARQNEPNIPWVFADVEDGASLRQAMTGMDAVVYLVHQMRQVSPDLVELERASAQRVLDAAEFAGVKRLVYLGGPEPAGTVSRHLEARLETGRVLRSGGVSTVELRAGMVIGAESESWLMVRDLAHRLPVMVLPSWLKSRSQPIGIDDVVVALAQAIQFPTEGSRVFDLPGPETLTAREILERTSRQIGIRPVMIPVPVLTPKLSSHWLRFVTRANFKVAKKLVQGLTCDLVSTRESFWDHLPTEPTPFDEAVRRALANEDPTTRTMVARIWERGARFLALGTVRETSEAESSDVEPVIPS